MADLENLLLQAAGRTNSSGRKNYNNSRQQSKWQRDNKYPDGSDSDDDSPHNSNYRKRKSSGSQVPLKKRFDAPEKDKRGGWREGDEREHDDDEDEGGNRSGNDSDSAPSVGSDLYRDEADKEELGKMSELDREMILAERSTKIDDYKLKQMARASSSKIDKSRKESPPPLPRGRSSARNDKSAAKSALNELRAKRMRQQDSEGYRSRLRGASGGSGLSSFAGRESSPGKHRATSPPSDMSNEDRNGGRADSEDERFPEDKKIEYDEDLSPSELAAPKFEDIKDITIRRSKLAKWFMEPFFEELISGCFVRIGIGRTRSGPRYKLCLVRNVDASDSEKQYKLENYTTCKWLNCIWGNESSAARWQMALVSDQPVDEKEFKEWQWEVERTGGRMPTRQEVLDKKEEIKKINSYVYSAATVKQMLQEKKQASLRPVNIAAEKDRLRKEMEIAQSRRDKVEVERIGKRFKELEEMSKKTLSKDDKAIRLAEMNRKNQAENFKNASEMKPVNTALKSGEAGYDPFSRRWTRSMNYYVSKTAAGEILAVVNVENQKQLGDGLANGMEGGEAATTAALVAAADAGKLVDTNAPVDYGTSSNFLHNFELPISLSGLQKFGGPQGMHLGFMARKQNVEAIIGYRVPDSDGRRHPLTLTVSDYKRRRGLL